MIRPLSFFSIDSSSLVKMKQFFGIPMDKIDRLTVPSDAVIDPFCLQLCINVQTLHSNYFTIRYKTVKFGFLVFATERLVTIMPAHKERKYGTNKIYWRHIDKYESILFYYKFHFYEAQES